MIEVELPDGNVLEVDTDDIGTAQNAARSYLSKQATPAPVPSEGGQPIVPTAAPEQSAGGGPLGLAASAGTGLWNAATGLAGLPGDVGKLIAAGSNKALSAMGIMTPEQAQENDRFARRYGAPGSEDVKRVLESVIGQPYQPRGTAEEYAKTIGEFAPGALTGPGGMLRRFLTQAAVPALASETAGQLTKGTSAEPWARLAGGIGGAVAPSIAAKVVSPLTIPAANRAAVKTLEREGIELTAGQKTGKKSILYAESELGGGADINARQSEQLTRAALRRVGEDSPRATTDVIDGAFDRIGTQMDTLAAKSSAAADPKFVTDVISDVRSYNAKVSAPNRVPAVGNYASEISNALSANGNVLLGPIYQSLRSRIEATARGISNPEAREALRDLKQSLDSLVGRNLSGADAAAWKEARKQYRNLLVVERAATGGGAQAASGILTPASLRNAEKAIYGRRNVVRGRGDFTELANAAVAVMSPMPQSGTAPRSFARAMATGAGALLGGGMGAVTHGDMSLPAILGGFVGPAAVGKALMSGPIQKYLANHASANLRSSAAAPILAQLLQSSQNAQRSPLQNRRP